MEVKRPRGRPLVEVPGVTRCTKLAADNDITNRAIHNRRIKLNVPSIMMAPGVMGIPNQFTYMVSNAYALSKGPAYGIDFVAEEKASEQAP